MAGPAAPYDSRCSQTDLTYNEYTTCRNIYVGVTCGQLNIRSFLKTCFIFTLSLYFFTSKSSLHFLKLKKITIRFVTLISLFRMSSKIEIWKISVVSETDQIQILWIYCIVNVFGTKCLNWFPDCLSLKPQNLILRKNLYSYYMYV